mgnify:CR=1 FL=1|jgi:hypothetical protein
MNRNSTIYSGEEIVESIKINVVWDRVRKARNKALKNSDWRFMSDQSPSQEWIDYRVFLRNLPQNYYDESDEITFGANAAADAWELFEKPEGA